MPATITPRIREVAGTMPRAERVTIHALADERDMLVMALVRYLEADLSGSRVELFKARASARVVLAQANQE